MIIKKIHIENYLCYYDNNVFELSEGLNIVLGENGEGKTKFFEAIDWLFNGKNSELDTLVSAKKLDETEVGDSFRVRVSMTVNQYGEKYIISKSFLVKKENPNECSTSSFSIEGIEENNAGERIQVDGQSLLDRIFPFQIRRYSMFKGEAELNIFDNEEALVNLINLFSDAKHFDKYSEKGQFLKEAAEKAVEQSTRKDKKNQQAYNQLDFDIKTLQTEKQKYLIHLNSTEDEIKKIQGNIEQAESHVSNADALETINKRIKKFEEDISNYTSKIDENYTTSLFDEKWVLVKFEDIFKNFAEKVSNYSLERRKLQSEHDKEIGIKEGKKKARAELLNSAVPLPIGVPSQSHMEEMLKDEICKVCNREAPKGSESYEFMAKRLNDYLASLSVEDDETEDDEVLFKYNYINRLENMKINHESNLKNLRSIETDIKDLFEFNAARKKDVEDLKEKLEQEKLEREKLLGNSSLAEEKLVDVLKNYNAWQRDLANRNKEQIDYDAELKRIEKELTVKEEEKDKIDMNSAHSFLISTRNILRDIASIFDETKEKKFDEFIDKLQVKSNHFFKIINIDAFTGTIVFVKRKKGSRIVVDVELQEDGRTFFRPNQSLETSMHIAILFAISELASETKEESFPMIFDAPTSSFGETKTAQFLNLIYETENQKILLIKDFLYTDKESQTLSIKKEFENVRRDKAFWVRLERPFDSNNLKTINTEVITL